MSLVGRLRPGDDLIEIGDDDVESRIAAPGKVGGAPIKRPGPLVLARPPPPAPPRPDASPPRRLLAPSLLDPSVRAGGAGRRAKPGDPAWPKTAAGAIALAAASALDLAASLSRRSETLLAVAPKLRARPAAKVVDLLLAEDCVSPAEAARQAPMTDRAARRLFDRLVELSAVRELSGRPTFRLYGL